MSKKIIGLESAYKEAIQLKDKNMNISANLVAELIEEYGELRNAVIDLKACLRTCQNVSSGVLEQYKDL